MPSSSSIRPDRRFSVRLRLREKLALWFWVVTVAATLLAIIPTYRLMLGLTIQEFGEKLEAVAVGGALGIDGDAFARLRDPKQMSSPEYRRIQQHLRKLKAANSGTRFRFVYTMAPTEKPGVWRYVVDAEQPSAETFSPLGATENFARGDIIVDAFHTNRPTADDDVKEYPTWGPLLTAAAPIHDSHGQVVGVVGVDALASAVQRTRDGLRAVAVTCALIGLAFAAGVGFLVAWGITRPVQALVRATQAVAGGDLLTQVPAGGRDELGQLARAFNEMIQGLRQRELYKQQFERYVSRQVAEKILDDPERDFWQGERRRATILFADIRGFTAMSEELPPEEVVSRLNEYLRLMIDIVFEYEGTLDKFIGDAIMAVFGAPVSMGNDEERAVRAALAMQAAVRELNQRWEREGQEAFRIGIGINTGEVVVGNIGSERRLEYAAIGDHVNLAARLEALTKEFGLDILISESTFEAVSHLVECRRIDRVTVRGRSQPVDVYELLDLRPPGPDPGPTDEPPGTRGPVLVPAPRPVSA